jgi:hypothetical protein
VRKQDGCARRPRRSGSDPQDHRLHGASRSRTASAELIGLPDMVPMWRLSWRKQLRAGRACSEARGFKEQGVAFSYEGGEQAFDGGGLARGVCPESQTSWMECRAGTESGSAARAGQDKSSSHFTFASSPSASAAASPRSGFPCPGRRSPRPPTRPASRRGFLRLPDPVPFRRLPCCARARL